MSKAVFVSAAHEVARAEGLLLVPLTKKPRYKGVIQHQGKYEARIWDGTLQHLGTFCTAEEAALAHARCLSARESDGRGANVHVEVKGSSEESVQSDQSDKEVWQWLQACRLTRTSRLER